MGRASVLSCRLDLKNPPTAVGGSFILSLQRGDDLSSGNAVGGSFIPSLHDQKRRDVFQIPRRNSLTP